MLPRPLNYRQMLRRQNCVVSFFRLHTPDAGFGTGLAWISLKLVNISSLCFSRMVFARGLVLCADGHASHVLHTPLPADGYQSICTFGILLRQKRESSEKSPRGRITVRSSRSSFLSNANLFSFTKEKKKCSYSWTGALRCWRIYGRKRYRCCGRPNLLDPNNCSPAER